MKLIFGFLLLVSFSAFSQKKKKERFEMVAVKGGSFLMGATTAGINSNECAHKVVVKDFSIGRYEVTQHEWRSIMGAEPSAYRCDDCPVENISWNDVQEFIQKLNIATGQKYRLPTEAEWEFAARGGIKTKNLAYAGNNDLDQVAWSGKNAGGKTKPVGKRLSNELGVYDMNGNVSEWCSDKKMPYPCEVNGSATTARIVRGGAFTTASGDMSVYKRDAKDAGTRSPSIGFRLVR